MNDPSREDRPGPEPSNPGGVLVGLTALLIGGAGVAFRLRAYFSFGATSLTRDEAALALNLMETGWLGVFRPLGGGQAAPVGFLLVEKAITDAFGTSEFAFRALSLVTSILILPLFYLLVRNFLSTAGILVGLGVIAISEPLIGLGTIFKQYSSDTCLTLIYLNVVLWAWRRDGGAARYVVVGSLGTILIWFSFPSVFVIGGTGLTLIGWELAAGRLRSAVCWVAAMSVCALSFGLAYALSYRNYSRNDALLTWWTYAFAPFPPRSLSDLKWYSDNFFLLFPSEVGIKEAGVGAAMLLFGAYCLVRDPVPVRRVVVPLLLAPIGLTLVASALHKYPFGDRTMLFSSPLLAALVAAGVAAIWDSHQAKARILAAMIVGIMALYPAYLELKYLATPDGRIYADVKPTLGFIADHRKDGDVLYVHWDAETHHDYYVKARNYRDLKRVPAVGSKFPGEVSRQAKLEAYEKAVKPLLKKRRVWLLLGIAGKPEEEIMLDLFDRHGQRLEGFSGLGSAAYLYEIGPIDGGGSPLGD
jgi:hypothetical protein